MEATYTPKPLTAEQLTALSAEVKRALTDLYGDRLDQVILYGSYARGDFHAESDVDYLVVLRDKEVKGGREIWFMGEIIGDMCLKYGVHVSVLPTSSFKYLQSALFLYQNVRREGQQL
jgi:uncharacterized protein